MAAFIIPWVFSLSGALLMQGTPLQIIQATITALIGTYALASGAQGFFLEQRLPWFMRGIALACALCMIISGTLTDLIGVALLAVLIIYVKFLAKGKAIAA